MDKKVTDAHVVEIAKFLPKWKAVARLLGLDSEMVKDIEHRFRDGEKQRYEALMKWVEKEGSQATYEKLYDVLLLEMEEEEAAGKVKELTGTRAVINGEPIPRWSHVAVAHSGKVYVWGGRSKDASQTTKLISVVEKFDPVTMKWTQVHTTGEHPQWLERCTCTCTEDGGTLYVFGGYHEGTFSNSLYMLTLDTMSWEEIHCCDPECLPGRKAAAGMVIWNNDTLVLFGGYGLPPTKRFAPDTAYVQNTSPDGAGWTNDLYLFKLPERSWTFQHSECTPPPCNGFSFVAVSNNQVLRYGGSEPRKCVSRLDVLDLTQWRWNKVDIDPAPEGRKFHSTACFMLDPGSPQLLIIGGVLSNKDTTGEIWILDYCAKKWTKVDNMLEMKRYWHTATCLTRDSVIQVVGFGGCPKNGPCPPEPIAEPIVFDIDITSMTVRLPNNTPLLQHLNNEVAKVIPAKWRLVGIQLKLSPHILENFQSQNGWRPNCNECCFEEVFKEWKKQFPESYSWTTLIQALKTLSVGEDDLAHSLSTKYT